MTQQLDNPYLLAKALHARIKWEQEHGCDGYDYEAVPEDVLEQLTKVAALAAPSSEPESHLNGSQSQVIAQEKEHAPRSVPQVESETSNEPHAPVSVQPQPQPATRVQLNSHVDSISKESAVALSELKFSLGQCTQCELNTSRMGVVFSDGTMNATLAFVGDYPSREEDLVSMPFIGKTGHLLNKIILAIGQRRETVYLTNLLKCSPAKESLPTDEQRKTCGVHLLKQLRIVKPKMVVALGQGPAQFLLNTQLPIEEVRGQFYKVDDLNVMPTFGLDHMLQFPESKREVWEDMKKVKQALL